MTEWAALCAGDTVYIALGSNLGDRAAHLAAARSALAGLPGTSIVSVSDVEETAPLGPAGQGPYLNQMVAMHTSIEPLTLLDHLHDIERARGRERRERWGARTLDLDIVCFGGRVIAEPRLVVPHPELPNREFWWREMVQAAARMADPPTAGQP
jgi:2-amino-4-hydroxy-6-hydroxymethyldihydropteridine diphosphokinase